MGGIQGLDGDLHKLASGFHHFVNFFTRLINNGTPLPWNSKALDAINFVFSVKPSLGNLHILSDVGADGMLRINNCPRVILENKYRL